MDDDERRAHDARWTVRALDAAACSLRAVGQSDAASLVDEYVVSLARDMSTRGIVDAGDGSGRPPDDAVERLRALIVEGAPCWTWPSADDGDDPGRTAQFLRLVRSMLVDDSGDGLDLLPVPLEEWFGTPLAVHDLPTAHGRLSFALRWHGARPALLWELDAHPSMGDTIVPIAASRLDPAWSSTDRRSEDLLAEPAHVHVHPNAHDHDHQHDHEHVDERAELPTRPPFGEGDSFM